MKSTKNMVSSCNKNITLANRRKKSMESKYIKSKFQDKSVRVVLNETIVLLEVNAEVEIVLPKHVSIGWTFKLKFEDTEELKPMKALIYKNDNTCTLRFNKWYGDNVTLEQPIEILPERIIINMISRAYKDKGFRTINLTIWQIQ